MWRGWKRFWEPRMNTNEHEFFGAGLFFFSPRRRSGERTEERGILTKRPFNGGAEAPMILAVPGGVRSSSVKVGNERHLRHRRRPQCPAHSPRAGRTRRPA